MMMDQMTVEMMVIQVVPLTNLIVEMVNAFLQMTKVNLNLLRHG